MPASLDHQRRMLKHLEGTMESKPRFRKSQIVTYASGPNTVNAIVRCAHRNGTATVEARYVIDKNGKAEGGYIGHTYTINEAMLSELGS